MGGIARAFCCIALLVMGAAFALYFSVGWGTSDGVPYKIITAYAMVTLFGVLVAIGELLSRYRDDPLSMVASPPALLYTATNALGALVAFYIVRAANIQVFAGAPLVGQIFLAGFGSIAFFRSSLFTARVGNTDVGLGPSFVLKEILGAADRSIDREQAENRARMVGNIMKGINFEKASVSLPVFCFGLMQNVTPDQQEQVGKMVLKLAEGKMESSIKSLSLGVLLLNVVGADVLQQAVDALGGSIRDAAPGDGADMNKGPPSA